MIVFYFLVAMMPMDQYHLWGMFIGVGTTIKYVGLLCILYAIFHLATRHAPPHYFTTVQAPIFLVFVTLTFVSYWLMGSKFSLQSSVFMSCLSIAFLFFVVLSVVDTVERLRWTLLTAVAAMGWASLYVFKEWLRDPMWRPGSISGDANYFALNAGFVLPVALLLVLRSRAFWERIFALGCMAAIIVSNNLGASRGGLLGVAAAFLWLIWHSPRRLRNFVIIFLLLVPPLLLLPSSPLRRLAHPQPSDVTGERNRLIAWKAGLRMIEHHPLTGIGVGQFKPKMLQYADRGTGFTSIAHNTYIEVAAETGLPAFLLFTALLFFTYRTLSQVRRETSETGPPLVHLAALSLQAGFVGYLVGAFFLSAEYQKLFWLWVFLSMTLPALVRVPADDRQKKHRYKLVPAWTAPAHALGRGVSQNWRLTEMRNRHQHEEQQEAAGPQNYAQTLRSNRWRR